MFWHLVFRSEKLLTSAGQILTSLLWAMKGTVLSRPLVLYKNPRILFSFFSHFKVALNLKLSACRFEQITHHWAVLHTDRRRGGRSDAHQRNNKATQTVDKGIGTLILITYLGVASQRRVTAGRQPSRRQGLVFFISHRGVESQSCSGSSAAAIRAEDAGFNERWFWQSVRDEKEETTTRIVALLRFHLWDKSVVFQFYGTKGW